MAEPKHYKGFFVPKVRSFEIEDEGEKQTFYIRKPRGGEMLDKLDQEEMTRGQASRETLQKVLVNEDGSPLTTEQFQDILDMESSAFVKVGEVVGNLLAGKKPTGEPKKD